MRIIEAVQDVLNLFEVRIDTGGILFWQKPVKGSPQCDIALPIECFDREFIATLKKENER